MVAAMKRMKTLRSERSFNKFIDQKNCIVIVYHFLCPACETYLGDMKHGLDLMGELPIGRIHVNLDWVIKEAGMIGDVEEENTFMVDRFQVGNLFPSTLFFKNGNLIRRVDGALAPKQLKAISVKVFNITIDNKAIANGPACTPDSCPEDIIDEN